MTGSRSADAPASGFLEGKRARNLESHVRRIDIVILAVIEDGAEVHYGKSRQEAAAAASRNALLD